MSRTTARAAAMQMIYEKISGGQGGEETLKMVYDELRADGLPGVNRIEKKEPDQEDREYITAALEGVLSHREELDELIDGPFVLAEKSLELNFRGSRNQRVLNVPESLRSGCAAAETSPRWLGEYC